MKFKTILVMVFATIIVVFSIQNIDLTDVRFLYWKTSTPLVIIILGSFVFGLIVGLLVSIKKPVFRKESPTIEKVSE